MSKFKTKVWNGEPARYIQLKMDGNYTRIVTGEFGRVHVYTSTPTDITEKCRNFNWLRPHYSRVPFGTIVLGELYVPGKPCSCIKTALNEQWEDLKFGAFAVENLPADAPLEEIASFCKFYGIEFLKWRRTLHGDTVEELMEKLPPDAEGYVLKNANLKDWYKLKPVLTIDLIVSGFTDGEGKYYGQIGSIVCKTTEGCEVANVSGMEDSIRQQISSNPSAYIGRILEVKYQAVGTQGRLRHPRFVQWRDDKLPADCGLEQDWNLRKVWL